MSIEALSIRHFRSIASLSEKTKDLNIFVGQNDEGKSNVLRALDLFFNGETQGGYEFNWARDYCGFAVKRSNKAEEISIEVVVRPPLSFANQLPVIWTKRWRKEGLHDELLRYGDGAEVKSTTKIAAFLKAMRFDYVPAIKGKDYFQSLMAKVYDMLAATVEEKIREASGSFTKTINDNTKPILKEILARLGLSSTIELPATLRALFAQLEFTSIAGTRAFSLDQRGDGIKVRHIPIVLRWLATQANHLSERGRPKSVTVWGYEEPENNLELLRCFDLAKEFVDGSSEIQTFVTTHSPAFYSVFRKSDAEKVALFLVTKDESRTSTIVNPLSTDDMISLDSSMGLMHLLEPHFEAARNEIATLRAAIKHVTDVNRPTLFCEGPTDKALIEAALRIFYPASFSKIVVKCSNHHGGGHSWVGEMLVAWSHSRPSAKAVGLFDKDAPAIATAKECSQKIKNAPSGKTAFALYLTPNEDIKECARRHFKVPFAIEELLPCDLWDFAEQRGWLHDRNNPIGVYGFSDTRVAFKEYVATHLPEPRLRRMVLHTVTREHKLSFTKHVLGLPSAQLEAALSGLKPTLKEILGVLEAV